MELMYDEALDNFVIAEEELDMAREKMINLGKDKESFGHRLAKEYGY